MRLGRLLRLRLFTRLSIRFHSSSIPSPVTAETGSTGASNTDSSCLIARIRSPRASLSILVATTAASAAALETHSQAARSFSSPGCLASTSNNAAGDRANTARAISSNAGSARALARCWPSAYPNPGRSTRWSGAAFPRVRRYTFASRVLPGDELVRAIRCRTSELIRLDLPTFERPTKAISASGSRGRSPALVALVTKVASIFKGLDGLDGLDGQEGALSCLSCLSRPSCLYVQCSSG